MKWHALGKYLAISETKTLLDGKAIRNIENAKHYSLDYSLADPVTRIQIESFLMSQRGLHAEDMGINLDDDQFQDRKVDNIEFDIIDHRLAVGAKHSVRKRDADIVYIALFNEIAFSKHEDDGSINSGNAKITYFNHVENDAFHSKQTKIAYGMNVRGLNPEVMKLPSQLSSKHFEFLEELAKQEPNLAKSLEKTMQSFKDYTFAHNYF